VVNHHSNNQKARNEPDANFCPPPPRPLLHPHVPLVMCATLAPSLRLPIIHCGRAKRRQRRQTAAASTGASLGWWCSLQRAPSKGDMMSSSAKCDTMSISAKGPFGRQLDVGAHRSRTASCTRGAIAPSLPALSGTPASRRKERKPHTHTHTHTHTQAPASRCSSCAWRVWQECQRPMAAAARTMRLVS
jgi:hypothetical protein